MFRLEGIKYKNIIDIKQLIISANKVTCIVGESGSGKTTLIRMLNKMISPNEGEIFYNSTPISSINSVELRREIVMLPQAPAIFKGDVKDNLLIGLNFSEKPSVNDTELLNILKKVHLNKLLSDNAAQLSGGEKQRLALGRVILMDPKVLLLDEPSSALDEETEKIIMKQLVQYTRQNSKSLIIVTHSKKIPLAYADHIIEIKEGKVLHQEEKTDG